MSDVNCHCQRTNDCRLSGDRDTNACHLATVVVPISRVYVQGRASYGQYADGLDHAAPDIIAAETAAEFIRRNEEIPIPRSHVIKVTRQQFAKSREVWLGRSRGESADNPDPTVLVGRSQYEAESVAVLVDRIAGPIAAQLVLLRLLENRPWEGLAVIWEAKTGQTVNGRAMSKKIRGWVRDAMAPYDEFDRDCG